MMLNSIIASTSTLHGESYLQYLLPTLEELYHHSEEVLFIPYARPSGITHNEYTQIAQNSLARINKKVKGIHEYKNPALAIKQAKNIFTGGGNTFLLVEQLYKHNLITPLLKQLQLGTTYLGTSAGSNICGLTMQTTNDMPIAYPPSFKTLGILPFNINPHYQDPDTNGIHMGETRATRITEFHQFSNIPVIGLREGSWIHATRNQAILKGKLSARLFKANNEAIEINPETDINSLITPDYLA